MKKKRKKMKLTSFEDLKDEIFGKVGTPKRDEYERELKQELKADKTKFSIN